MMNDYSLQSSISTEAATDEAKTTSAVQNEATGGYLYTDLYRSDRSLEGGT